MVQEALMAELRKELEDKAMITELDGKGKKLEAELTREDATPKTLLLADVMKDLLKLGCQYVVIGETTIQHHQNLARQGAARF